MTYAFRNATGRICCESNDIKYLCPTCKTKAGGGSVRATSTHTAAALRTSAPVDPACPIHGIEAPAPKPAPYAPPSASTPRVSQPTTTEPPKPYTLALAAQRQGQEPPAASFESRHAAERRHALEQERVGAMRTANQPRRLSAAELATYEPPRGYTLALAAQKGSR